jgi:acyl-CoA reductase-like NAD-dependent aldehyde dehydrogenase
MITRSDFFIDGTLVPGHGTETLAVVNPSTEEIIARLTLATRQDVDHAVAAARRAFDTGPWPRMTIHERRGVLQRAGELLAPRATELTSLVASQNGVPICFSSGDVAGSFAAALELDAFATERRDGTFGFAEVVREPVGVVGCIVPWNAPVALALSKLLPALLAGCTTVLKSAPETPLQDYAVADAFAAAGLPAGVLNILVADREVSESLVSHRDVDMISFTGSTSAGRRIGSICGEHLKRVTLELGGKSAAILLDDADLEVHPAVALKAGVLLINGESCAATSRILVPRSRHDEMAEALATVMSGVRVGDALSPDTEVGPLVAQRQRSRVEGLVESAVREGAKVMVGGGRPPGLDRGWFIEPTLLIDAHNDMQACREEIFGPVATVIPYEDDEDAIRIANDSAYGLAGTVFTGDLGRGRAVADAIRTGTVGVNCSGLDERYPYGGYKDSGVGRMHGPEGFAEYFEIKTIAFPPES